MRWVTLNSILDAREKAKEQWHTWFAWYPVVFTADENEEGVGNKWVFGESIERKQIQTSYPKRTSWQYRVTGGPPSEF